MIPRIVLRIAGHSGRNPLLINIAVDVPFVPPRNAAFVPPNIAFASCELIDVKLQCLGVRDCARIKIEVVDEVPCPVRQGVAVVGKPDCRKRTDQMVVPQDIGIWASTTNVMLGSVAILRRRPDSGTSGPIYVACG